MVTAKQANLYLVFLKKNLNSNVKVFDDNLIINKKYISKEWLILMLIIFF